MDVSDSLTDNTSDTGNGAGFAPDTVASSNLHFSSQISRLRTVNSHPERNSQNPPSDGDMSSTTDIYGLGQLKDQSTPLNLRWPSLAEAHELLDIVLKSVGKLQHLIEPRMTSDRLSLTYQGSPPPTSSNDLWYNKLLMMFALGELLRGRLDENSRLPGIQYFVEAERCLPCLPQLRAMGLHAIGVLGMVAFYLQCADSRDNAYAYAGTALKLAITSGMARTRDMQVMTRSERTHRNRLWWTIYMQERRLAAATGHPVSISDVAIGTFLPTDCPGFESSVALNMNIKLARITGQTMHAIYGRGNLSAGSYICRVNKILANLLDVAQAFPSEYTIHLSGRPKVSRVPSTLHLMLYQLGSSDRPPSTSQVLSFGKFSDACIEAAGHCLKLLEAMLDTELIAIFGFFDLDAAFSAAFVFVLVESIYSHTQKIDATSGIQRASSIMQFLAAKGNMAAARRRTDIERMCHHLGIDVSRILEDQAVRQERHEHIADEHGGEGGYDHHDAGPGQTMSSIIQDEANITPEDSCHFDWAKAAATFFDQREGNLMN
ncbi:hypothetical protein FOTG_18917 [Fusarium oxysporum f. sp. vasinfectum 25433]|uniref:Xylanolytic transcriptional activator regulatory domain-containing protein n=1 Tax=Fusarium oxysporum f. sp. vasinfectum 25433 TaxID=1089449 RepID=X0LVR5_FUSOX|nr:hypothetical protein FOTG_18917 [Fusarium oxysporum f. sp. vasinfectum 25433]